MKKYRYIYGPVPSWRLGSSLGIDPISAEAKACSFDCTYCQLGLGGNTTLERRVFVSVDEVAGELESLPESHIDYITFSGTGEPTLAKNLGRMIKAVKESRPEKIAVLTNSSLISRPDVREELLPADLVVCKLDAHSQVLFESINRPAGGLRIRDIAGAIKSFRKIFPGRLALQVMLVGSNIAGAREIAEIAREIAPDEIQLNTPLRPCAEKPLPRRDLDGAREHFRGCRVMSVYEAEKKKVAPMSRKDTLRRRGKV